MDGEPAQPDVRAGLGRVPGPVARGEPDAALVEHEPRVAGEVPVGYVVVHCGQFGGGRRAAQPGGLVGDRRGQLGEHVGQPQPAQPQHFPGVHDEGARVGDRFAGPARATRFDRPGVERAPPGPERVGGAGQLQPARVAVGGRLQQVLVGQFAEHLVHDQGTGRPPGGRLVQGHMLLQAERGERGAVGQLVHGLAAHGVEDRGRPPRAEAEVGGADAVGVQFGVLHEQRAGGTSSGDAVVRADDEPAAPVAVDARRRARPAAPPVGASAYPVAATTAAVRRVALRPCCACRSASSTPPSRWTPTTTSTPGVSTAPGEPPPTLRLVELVVDRGEGVGVDALVQLPLRGQQPVAHGSGSPRKYAV